MLVVSVLFIVLTIASIRPMKPIHKIHEQGYSIENTGAIKGLLSISIIMCHLSGKGLVQISYLNFSIMGSIGVGIFFFYSGYALTVRSRNQAYFKDFLTKRFTKILVPFFAMLALYLLIIVVPGKESIKEFADSFIYGYPVSNSWYVFTALICYLLFYIFFKHFSGGKAHLLSLAAIIVYMIVTAIVFKKEWWYMTVLCFNVGLFWGSYNEKIRAILKKRYILLLVLSILMCAFAYLLPAINNRTLHLDTKFIFILNNMLMAIAFTLLLALLGYKTYFNNKITAFLGKISYETYLLHGLIINVLISYGVFDLKTRLNQEIFAIIVVITTLILATLMHKLDSLMIAKLMKKGAKNA